MYIEEIHLENIRGFSHLELNLARPDRTLAGWTVFAGKNGSGKTTLLKALVRALYGELHGQSFANQWLRKGSDKCLARLIIRPGKEDHDAPFDDQHNNCEFGWTKTGLVQHDARTGALDIKKIKSGSGWFLTGYGPFRRLSGEGSDRQGRLQMLVEERVSTLFYEGAALPESVRWLQRLNYQSLEHSDQAEEAAVLEGKVLSLLNDGLLPEGVTFTKVSSEGLHILQNDQELELNQLSDGYRSTLAMVIDMVRHLDQAFTGLVLEKGPTHCIVPHEGVVLIDEVDAHLHVSWQKKIGFWLKTRFPNIQFLVTTHSPYICQAADPNGLIRLPDQGDSQEANHFDESQFNTVVNGSIADASVTDLFGLAYTHSESAEVLREELAQLEGKMMRNRISEEELARRSELVSQMPRGGCGDVGRAINQLREAWK